MVSIFGVVVFTVHSWSLLGFLYHLPSFALKYNLGEMFAIFFYHMTFAFLECVFFCGILVIISAVLPSAWVRRGFVYKGFLLVLFAAFGSIVLQGAFNYGVFEIDTVRTHFFYPELGAGLLLLIGLFILAQKMIRVQKMIVSVVDQISVMLYVYLPLDLLGLLVVGYRLLR